MRLTGLIVASCCLSMAIHAQTVENNVVPPSHPMTFQDVSTGGNCCEWIAADGEITIDTPKAFRDFLASLGPTARTIHEEITFNSNGGDIGAAMALGREIRKTSFSTGVGASTLYKEESTPSNPVYSDAPGRCMSACVLAFMGGKSRLLHHIDRIGFGEFDIEQLSTHSQRFLRQAVDAYAIEMGVDPEVFSSGVVGSYVSVEQAILWGLASP